MRTEIVIENISRGYDCLFQSAKSKGHWEEVRNTALVGLALEYIEPLNSGWGDSIKRFLVEEQMTFDEENSSWGEEIWDSAMALMALNHLGYDNRSKIFKNAINWIVSLHNQNKRLNWHDEPWETSWAILAIMESNPTTDQKRICLDSTKWLIALQSESGKIIAPHYTAYAIQICNKMLAAIHDLPEQEKDSFRNCIKKSKEYLITHIDEDKLWQGEAWANGQILWILCSNDLFPVKDDEIFWKVVNWFTEEQDKVTGKWVDVEGTASAILGLANLFINKEGLKDKFELRNKLKSHYQVPQLMLKRKLVQKHEDGYLSLNIHKSALSILAAFGSIAGGVLFLLEFWSNIKTLFGW